MTDPDRLLNMTTGPVAVSDAVQASQADGLTTPHHDSFWRLHDETLGRLGDILGTAGRVLAFHGSIRAGLDVALANLITPAMRVLAIANGYWGELIGAYAERHGARVSWLRAEPLLPTGAEAVAAALAAEPGTALVTLVHVETNTGIVNPLAAIGEVVRAHGALFYVDTACSAGAMAIETDRWGIDVGVTGSQKCLCALPGLAVVSVSERAWAHMDATGSPAAGTYYDFAELDQRTVGRAELPPYTQPTTLFRALHAALGELAVIGHERWFARHREAGARFRAAMRADGLAMLPDGDEEGSNREAACSDTVMAVALPEDVSLERFRATMAEEFGILVLGNLGAFATRSFRVGLMSPPQLEEASLAATLGAIPRAVERARE